MKNIVRICTMAAVMAISLTASAQTQEIRVFSHRGGRMEFDENTMPAFKASYDAGYRGFETDIRLTADGVPVIAHDSKLTRVAGVDAEIENMTIKEFKAVRTKAGNPLLTLDDFLSFLKGKDNEDLYVEFEIKAGAKRYTQERLEELCDKLYKRVTSNKPKGAVYLFTSSDYRALRYLQQKYGTDDLLLITSKPLNDDTITLCKSMGVTRIGATMDGTSRAAVRKAHEKGLVVSLWPGKSTDDLMLGAYLGADFLCTDKPIEYMKFAKEKAPWLNIKY